MFLDICNNSFNIIIIIIIYNSINQYQQIMSDLKKLFKKNKNKNKEEDKPLQDNINIAPQDDQDLTNTALVQIQESKEKKPKPVKVQVKQIEQVQINKFQLPGKVQIQERKSWVPHLSGITQKFDFEKQKQHFVGIGQQYNPPVQPKKGMNNFASLTISDQDKKQNNLIQTGPVVNLTGAKIKFTNTSLNSNIGGNIQKTAQQLKQQQAEARLQGLKSTPVSKEMKEAKEAQRKRKQQQSKISQNEPKKIVQFTPGSGITGFKQIEKTAQQLKQEILEAQLNQLKGKPVSKAEKEQREAQRKRKQQEAAQILNKTEQKKVYTFVNNKLNVNVQQNKKPIGLSVQQMKQLQLEAKLQKSTPLTKQQAELQKQKIRIKQQKRKQDQALEQERKKLQAEVPQSKKPRFMNSKKVGDQVVFMQLQKPKQKI